MLITDFYTTDERVGSQGMAVVNFAPLPIGPFLSGCLIVGFYRDESSFVLAVRYKPVPNGGKLA